MSQIFSSDAQLAHIERILCSYLRLPFSTDEIPGRFMEAVLAHVRGGTQLATYDYIDVHQKEQRVGWSIKSTKAATPLTWKRAKIANKVGLITASQNSTKATQALGDAILEFCNEHAERSLHNYDLDEIGYARLILFRNGTVRYFERLLCSRKKPQIFNPRDFTWKWSTQRIGTGKEQLSALHGFYEPTGDRWWAWHGLGENQLHFTGERAWWPPEGADHAVTFRIPSDTAKISLERLTEILDSL
jgi:hypothetical protein